jgi:hypothetical protein
MQYPVPRRARRHQSGLFPEVAAFHRGGTYQLNSDTWSLAWLIVLFWIGYAFLVHSKLRYSIQNGVPYGQVTVHKEPHDCDWFKAPIGDKNCRFEPDVSLALEKHQQGDTPNCPYKSPNRILWQAIGLRPHLPGVLSQRILRIEPKGAAGREEKRKRGYCSFFDAAQHGVCVHSTLSDPGLALIRCALPSLNTCGHTPPGMKISEGVASLNSSFEPFRRFGRIR